MKCPECKFVCSDLRDICPRCYVDMRPFKEALGIQLTSPKAPYEELLKKLGVQTELKPQGERRPLWGRWFRSVSEKQSKQGPKQPDPAETVENVGPPPGSPSLPEQAEKVPVERAIEAESGPKVSPPMPPPLSRQRTSGTGPLAPPRGFEVPKDLIEQELKRETTAAESRVSTAEREVEDLPPLTDEAPAQPPTDWPEPRSWPQSGTVEVSPADRAEPEGSKPLLAPSPTVETAEESGDAEPPPSVLAVEEGASPAPPPALETPAVESNMSIALQPDDFPERLQAAKEDIRQLRLETLADSEAPLDQYIDALINKVLERAQAMSSAGLESPAPAAPPDVSEAEVTELIERSLSEAPDLDAETEVLIAPVREDELKKQEAPPADAEAVRPDGIAEPQFSASLKVPDAQVIQFNEKSSPEANEIDADAQGLGACMPFLNAPEGAPAAQPPPEPEPAPPAKAVEAFSGRTEEPSAAITRLERPGESESQDGLFRQALEELRQIPASLELTAEVFSREHSSEELKLLFSLSRDAIENPESEKVLHAGILASEQRAVQAPGLAAQLRKVEEVINAPRVTLHGPGAAAENERMAEPEKTAFPPLVRAPVWKRLQAFGIDFLVVVLASVVIAGGLFLLRDGPARAAAFDPIDAIELACSVVVSVLLLSVLYPLAALLLSRATPGLYASNLMIVNRDERKLGLSQAALRTLLQPLSSSLFGWLPLLWGGRSVQDRLSGTDVCLQEEEPGVGA